MWSARYLRRRTRSRRRPREGKTKTSAFPFVRISFIFLLFLVSKKHKDQSKLPSVPSFVPAVFMPAVATTPRRRHLAPADSNGPLIFFDGLAAGVSYGFFGSRCREPGRLVDSHPKSGIRKKTKQAYRDRALGHVPTLACGPAFRHQSVMHTSTLGSHGSLKRRRSPLLPVENLHFFLFI